MKITLTFHLSLLCVFCYAQNSSVIVKIKAAIANPVKRLRTE